MLPICPLDGYKILKLGIELFIPFRLSFKVTEIISFIVLGVLAILKFSIIKSNVLIFVFMIFMVLEEAKNCKYIINRFYIERLHHDFKYPRIDIKTIKNMYKNKTNYIKGEHEKKVIRRYFT